MLGRKKTKMLPELLAAFAVGIVAGLWIGKKYMNRKEELTTEDCVNFLKEKGYWVRLNAGPDGKVYK